MTIWTIVAGSVGVVALLGAGTFLLPKTVHVQRQATLSAAPETILALAASSEGYQAFNPYRTSDPDLKITPFGPVSGVGAGFRFDGKEGKGSQTVASVTADSVRYDIDLGAMGRPVQTISTASTPEGTQVVWSMDMDLGFNPVARVFGLFMDGMVGKTFEQGLDNLAAAT
ncbi:SRPBCC family protein [uncultured Roseibium sp.]|uniref:SRPBCC family protein n=1 Tax=uncultured Roseibium sp. TaxID=1936171 RepID=UPI0026331E17|nr:SRPBCC family protein [uncultured Roseibium sp.]